jgi:uncharacterized protein YndB with AHSA1/START domain
MMSQRHESISGSKPEPLVICRSFAAPRDLVFRAWSSAEHMKRWFSPAGYTVPDAEIDFRPGGVCAICMRSPEGQDFWSRGTYLEISPPDRLVFTTGVAIDGSKKFTAHTTVTFEDDGAGTRITVRQAYDIHDEAFLSAVDKASEGWRTTLDKLEQEVARMQVPRAIRSFMPSSRWSALTTPHRRQCTAPFRTRQPRPDGSREARAM